MKKSAIFRGFVFLLALLIAVCSLLYIFRVDSKFAHSNLQGYLQEEKGSLDAVYIGASDVLAFWQPLFGWAEHGIAVWSYSIEALPANAVKFLLAEAQKTQPDALFIISLSTFKGDLSGELSYEIDAIHRVANYLPASINKLNLIDSLTDYYGCSLSEKLEFYFPIIRFHSRWNDFQSWEFTGALPPYKSSLDMWEFKNQSIDISDAYEIYNTPHSIPDDMSIIFDDLLSYCDEQNLNVLFVKSPQAATVEQQGQMNTLENIAVERGYPCLDIMEDTFEIGINPHTDFYNDWHTNVHGSLKFCSYLADYLVDNYGFIDKRGQEGWESWDAALGSYLSYIGSSALPFELNRSPSIFSSIPRLHAPAVVEDGISVKWESIDNVDGYFIYRKVNNVWSLLVEVSPNTVAYVDRDTAPSTEYTYTVVPYFKDGDETLYGSFNVNGLSCQTSGE